MSKMSVENDTACCSVINKAEMYRLHGGFTEYFINRGYAFIGVEQFMLHRLIRVYYFICIYEFIKGPANRKNSLLEGLFSIMPV